MEYNIPAQTLFLHKKDGQENYRAGTHRVQSPAETLHKVLPFLPIFGITRLANITGLDKIGLPVVMAVRPNSKSLSVSQGKGFTLDCAKISAIMESVENYHAERIDLPVRFLSYEDICFKYKTLDPSFFSPTKIKPFTETTVIPWLKSKNLLTQQDIWVPYELVNTDYTIQTLNTLGYFMTDTNGLASGNTLLEATNHALCEVIERDALAIWQVKNRLNYPKRPSVDQDSIDDPLCQQLLKQYRDANILVRVFDITTEIGIPVFACEIMADGVSEALKTRPAMGSGCHPSKYIALSKALIEAAQSRLTFISGSRDDQTWEHYQMTLSNDTYKLLLDDFRTIGEKTSFAEIKLYNPDTPSKEYHILLETLANNGIKNILSVDLTKEEFGIPVVKVIAPELEGITNFEHRKFGSRLEKALRKQ